MTELLISIDGKGKTCNRCRYQTPHPDWARFPNLCNCAIFNMLLRMKKDKQGNICFYRLKKCIEKET